jgi:hypothetical protein
MVEADGPLDFALAVDYVRQAADGLAHAHSKDMVHCDIKPANLLVNRQGVVKILDMGMAKAFGRKPRLDGSESSEKDSQALVGTVDYMAPEQAMGDENLDRRVDIYSLGCTFYFLLTGHPPFPEGTLAERIVKHQSQEPKEIAEERPDTPAELIRICQKMMAKQPDERFQTASELSEVLANWRPVQTKILRATPLKEAEESGKETPEEGLPGDEKPAKESKIKALANRVVARWRQWVADTMADRRRMMIAAGVTITVSVLLIAGMIGWALSSAKARRLRLAAERAAAAEAKAEAERKKADFGDLSLAIDQPPGEPLIPSPAPAKAGPPPGKTGPPPKPGAPPPPPGTKAPPPVPGKAAPAAPAAPAPPKASPAAPAAQAPKTPAPAEAKPAAPAPAKKETPAPATPAPAKKEAPAPATPAPAPAAPADLLQEFPKVVDLPPIGESESAEFPSGPALLGTISGSLDQPVTIELVGKDTALRGKRQFTWEEKQTKDKKPGWVAQLEAPGKEDAKTDVAYFWRDKGGLLFRWAGGAAEAKRDCECLRNCALEMRAGGPAHVVPLRKPAQVEPILFVLERAGISTGTVPIEFLPDAANLRVEIVKVEGQEGHVLDPAGPMTLKTPVRLIYARKDRRGQQRPGVEFSVTAIVKGKGLAITIKLVNPSAPQYKSFLAAAAAGRPDAELQVRRISAEFAAAKEEGDKAKAAQKIEPFDMLLWFDDFYQAVNRKARLHFRVFIEAKEQRIELATTETTK